jgi:glycosyltransferase involved in cell wall biosynthesis
MSPSKRVEHIITALALFRRATGTGTLCLVGSGSDKYQQSLIRLAERLGVADRIVFHGRVTSSEKYPP